MVYGNETLGVGSVRCRAIRVKGFVFAIIAGQDRSGRLVTVTDDKQRVDDSGQENRRIKQSEITVALAIRKERVRHILSELEC